MTDTRYVQDDVPTEVLALFQIRDGVVRWADAAPPPSKYIRKRRAPWGEVAGGRTVAGRGRLVTSSGVALLTTDIRYALEHGGEWPWVTGGEPLYDGCGVGEVQLVRQRFALEGDTITWRVPRGYTSSGGPAYPAGSPVVGFALSGYRGRLVSTGGLAMVLGDVRYALTHGVWPWEFRWD